MGGAGTRGPCPGTLPGRHRRLGRLRHGDLFLVQPLLEPRSGRRHGDVPSAPHRQRQGFPVDPRQPHLRPPRAQRERPDRLFDVACRRASGGAVAACGRMRHGVGRRGDDRTAAGARIPCARGRDPVARRRMPRLRSSRAGDGLRVRRGRRGAAAAGRCARRRRPYLGRREGQRDQQRRRGQGGLPRALGRRSGGGRGRGAGGGRHRRGHRGLHRMPRHRHLSGRPDRGCGAHRCLPPHDGCGRLLRIGQRQDQHRAPRHRGGCRGADQDDARPAPPPDPADDLLRKTEPGHRLRRLALPRGRPAGTLARPPPSAARGCEFSGRRWHERACGA